MTLAITCLHILRAGFERSGIDFVLTERDAKSVCTLFGMCFGAAVIWITTAPITLVTGNLTGFLDRLMYRRATARRTASILLVVTGPFLESFLMTTTALAEMMLTRRRSGAVSSRSGTSIFNFNRQFVTAVEKGRGCDGQRVVLPPRRRAWTAVLVTFLTLT